MKRQPTIAPVVFLGARLAVSVAPFLLSLAGLTLVVIGVFVWAGLGPGLIATGVACFVAEWRVMGGGESEPDDVRSAGDRRTGRAVAPDGSFI